MRRFAFVTLVTLIMLRHVIAVEPPVTGLCVAPSGELFIGSQRGLEITDWGLERRTRLPDIDEPIHSLGVSRDEQSVAVGGGMPSEWGTLWILRWPSRKPALVKRDHDDTITSLDWSPDGQWLATASLDATVILYRAETMEPVHRFQGHSKGILDVVFVDDKHLLTASLDATIRMWSIGDKEITRTLKNHTAAVTGLKMLPARDGRLPIAVSISRDRTIRFWQPTIGRLLRFARLADEEPLSVMPLPSSDLVAIAGSAGTLYTVDHRDASVSRRPLGKDRLISIALHRQREEMAIGGFGGSYTVEPWPLTP